MTAQRRPANPNVSLMQFDRDGRMIVPLPGGRQGVVDPRAIQEIPLTVAQQLSREYLEEQQARVDRLSSSLVGIREAQMVANDHWESFYGNSPAAWVAKIYRRFQTGSRYAQASLALIDQSIQGQLFSQQAAIDLLNAQAEQPALIQRAENDARVLGISRSAEREQRRLDGQVENQLMDEAMATKYHWDEKWLRAQTRAEMVRDHARDMREFASNFIRLAMVMGGGQTRALVEQLGAGALAIHEGVKQVDGGLLSESEEATLIEASLGFLKQAQGPLMQEMRRIGLNWESSSDKTEA